MAQQDDAADTRDATAAGAQAKAESRRSFGGTVFRTAGFGLLAGGGCGVGVAVYASAIGEASSLSPGEDVFIFGMCVPLGIMGAVFGAVLGTVGGVLIGTLGWLAPTLIYPCDTRADHAGRWALAIAVLPVLVLLVLGLLSGRRHGGTYVVEYPEYQEPPRQADEILTDDNLDEKHPVWDESLVDSRLLHGWEVNQSAAVIGLECPAIKPDSEGEFLVLRPSYAQAIKVPLPEGLSLLPSTNLLDGAAKQFDDGLYAAVDLACYRGELAVCPAAPELVQKIFDALSPGSPARPFLAAALELAGRRVSLAAGEDRAKAALLSQFEASPLDTRPAGFYDWTPELKQVWRFFRFLQRELPEGDAAPCQAVAKTLEANPDLTKQYRAITGFYGRLTNPAICLTADSLIDAQGDFGRLAKQHGVRHPMVAVFPPSTTRETELFERLFSRGLPAGTNLMSVLIRRIRSGEVDLKPGDKDGWYQYQVYALETLLLPTKGQERDKLFLTASYKRRLIEAFQALVTKRRETHMRMAAGAKCAAAAPLGQREVRPRLRIEPCPTFYLRTARAYAFLKNLLLAAAGKDRLAKMHGLRQGGVREPDLAAELADVQLRFYGFYLLSCEDLGMRPQFLKDEPVDQGNAVETATKWLNDLAANPDLACDTRVSVPIAIDLVRNKTRLWATLGVRLARLDAKYGRPPRVRPQQKGGDWGDWREAEGYQLGVSQYVIPVDEFAEIELPGLKGLHFLKKCPSYAN